MSNPTVPDYLDASDVVYNESNPGGVETLTYLGSTSQATLLNDLNVSLSEIGLSSWTPIGVQYIPSDGFYGAAFLTNSGNIIIAFEGTAPIISSFAKNEAAQDFAISNYQIPSALTDATAFTASVLLNDTGLGVAASQVFVTGHSLGGIEAEYVASQLQLSGAAFGDTGLPNYVNFGPQPDFTNYIDYGDPVGNFASNMPSPFGDPGFVHSTGIDHVGTVKMLGIQSTSTVLPYFNSLPPIFNYAFNISYHELAHYAGDLGVFPIGASSSAANEVAPVDVLAYLNSALGTAGGVDFASAALASGNAVQSNDFTVSEDATGSVFTIVQNQSLFDDSGAIQGDVGTYVVTLDASDANVLSETFTDGVTGATDQLLPDTTSAGDSRNITLAKSNDTVFIENAGSFTGVISNFQIGDTIDPIGIGTATGATLSANDVLTIGESGGGSVGLKLDPAGSYGGDSFLLAPDGSGGTDITPQSTDVSFTAPNQTLLILNPSAADTDSNFQPGDTIDLAGIPPGKITQASGSPGVNVSTNSSSSFYIKISPSGNGTGSIQSDGNGGSDIIESATQLITYSYTGYAFTGLPTNLPAASFLAGSIDAQFTFEVPLGYTTTGASAGYWQYSTYSQNGGLLEPVLTDWTITVAGRTLNPTNTEASNYGSDFGFNISFDNGALSGSLTAIIKNSSGAFVTEVVTTASGDEAYFGPTPTSGGANTTPGIWTIESIGCFCKGVSIALESGDTPIESLAVGDLVRTRTGEAVPVQWIGHREVNCGRHPKPEQVWPVRVAVGAFGENLPHRDLWLSPDHAVYVDDVLIPIKHLINRTTIAQVPTDQVSYYHIELRHHDVLLAEGMPAESYLDTGDRSRFVNGGTHVALYPDFSARMWETMGCASLIVTGARLTAVRQRVNARVAVLAAQVAPIRRVA